jgi:hypothetical protein
MFPSSLMSLAMLVTAQEARILPSKDMVSLLETSLLVLMESTAQLHNSKMIPYPVRLLLKVLFPPLVTILVLTV